jgi:hypothetical protein
MRKGRDRISTVSTGIVFELAGGHLFQRTRRLPVVGKKLFVSNETVHPTSPTNRCKLLLTYRFVVFEQSEQVVRKQLGFRIFPVLARILFPIALGRR